MDGMNRRGFFGSILGGAAAASADPKAVSGIWQRVVRRFRPRPTPTLCTTFYTKEMLRVLRSNLQFVQATKREFAQPMRGDTITIRKPQRYQA